MQPRCDEAGEGSRSPALAGLLLLRGYYWQPSPVAVSFDIIPIVWGFIHAMSKAPLGHCDSAILERPGVGCACRAVLPILGNWVAPRDGYREM